MAIQTRFSTSNAPHTPPANRGDRSTDTTSKIETIRAHFPARYADRNQSSKRQRQALAVAAIVAGLAIGWLLIDRGAPGTPVRWLYDRIESVIGMATFMFPVMLILGGMSILLDKRARLPTLWQMIGAIVLALALAGLFALSSDPPRDGGGYLGDGFASLLSRRLNEITSAFALLVIGSFGVFLMTRTTPWGLAHDIRISIGTVPKDPQPLSAPQPPSPKPKVTKSKTTARKKPAALPSQPVINLPSEETKRTKPAKSTSRATVKAGDKLPLPDMTKLKYYDVVMPDPERLEANAKTIEETLESFKVETRVREVNPGPTVTQYTLEPGAGVKVRRITELQNDLALALAAPSIRIEAPVPGMARVGIEIPNDDVSTVGLRETIESPQFRKVKDSLPVPLGRDVNGKHVVGNLTSMPHLLIAGATGSGKSVCINGIISTFLMTKSPDELRLLMIDPKMVELTGYNGVPHLQCPVITEMDKVVGALRLIVQEMQRRYDLFNKAGVRNLDGYRLQAAEDSRAETVPYLVVIVDELADLMLTAPVDVEALLQRIAQMGRAAGIHLMLATQRPSVDVLTGVIKANVPARIAFAVSSLTDSRVILDLPGAERLLGKGDMLFLPPDAAKPVRVQGAFVDDRDVRYIVKHWYSVAPIPTYAEEWLNLPSSKGQGSSGTADYEDDPLMEQALEIVRSQEVASASMLQRRLRIGYNRAARIVEQMEEDGIVGPADGVKGRPVL